MHSIKMFLILIIFISCSNVSEKEQIVGNYYIYAGDTLEDMSLTYKTNHSLYKTVVGETVFAIGNNEEYIIVKQHPRSWPARPDKSVTNFFIVPVYQEYITQPQEGILGPLEENEFKDKMKELDLLDKVTFTKTYPYLE